MAHYEDLLIDQGSDVAIEIHCDSADGAKKDFSNYTVAAKLKLNYNSDSSNTTNFNAIIATPPTNGIITISLTNAQTNALSPSKRYVYDVETSFQDDSANTITERILEGSIHVTPSVTK